MSEFSKTIARAKKGLGTFNERADKAILNATRLMALEAERVAKEQIKGSHARGTPTPSRIGHPPTNIGGDLRRSIKSDVSRKGFAEYVAQIGPTVVYGRAVELGHPRWKNGTKYPFMAPTGKILRNSPRLRYIYTEALKRALP